jgi:chromosome segregation ATPase
MTEEQTDRLEGGTPFEIRVLRELANLNQRFDGLEVRLTNLEEKVDARLRDTRPIWEALLTRLENVETRLDGMDARLDSVDGRLERMETRLEKMDDKFEVVAAEWLDVRAEIKTVKKRLPAA